MERLCLIVFLSLPIIQLSHQEAQFFETLTAGKRFFKGGGNGNGYGGGG
eukprot:TCALIF_06707-PA protein Name:"Protein of unknown function" AED:0.20 eAED:0.20 QI:157/0.5/0.33/0.66/1/0.66/3/0/48